MSNEERRARLGIRHLLSEPGSDVCDVTGSMVALHSSDPTTVYLSLRARAGGFEVADLERALYKDRTVIRAHGMRRTLWVVDRGTLPLVINSSTRAIAAKERQRSIKLLEDGDVTDNGARWLDMVAPKVIEVIRSEGQILTRDLTRRIPELDREIVFRNKTGKVIGRSGLASRVALLLGMESSIVRTRPTGTWISSQYHWAAMDEWLEEPIAATSPTKASAAVVRNWLRTFGPGTEDDIRWWTGWPVKQVRAALADVGAAEVELESGTGYLLPDDLEASNDPGEWVALLPSLDPTAMGWKDRRWYLGEHSTRLFDRNGNAGPTIWVNGRVVGGWAQRKDGKVAHEVFEAIPDSARNRIEASLAELQEWLGDVNVTPRFRSPHDRELAS